MGSTGSSLLLHIASVGSPAYQLHESLSWCPERKNLNLAWIPRVHGAMGEEESALRQGAILSHTIHSYLAQVC